MNQDALMSMAQAMRNQAISLVQQAEAVITLLDGKPEDAKPACRSCGSTALLITHAGPNKVAICKDCNYNQPAA